MQKKPLPQIASLPGNSERPEPIDNLVNWLLKQMLSEDSRIFTESFEIDHNGMLAQLMGCVVLKDGYVRKIQINLIPNDHFPYPSTSKFTAPSRRWDPGLGFAQRVDLKTGEKIGDVVIMRHAFDKPVPQRQPWERPGWED